MLVLCVCDWIVMLVCVRDDVEVMMMVMIVLCVVMFCMWDC